MNVDSLLSGLITYLCFIPILTFHEFAHAWVAWKCGDDTARRLGRVSLNPIVHTELIGTVVLPLLAVMLSAADSQLASFIIGWGKPVPVNIHNLRRPRLDDTLVALAGPVMNILLAVAIVGLGKAGMLAGFPMAQKWAAQLAILSLFLCYFNLLPIPPLDGSHVLKNLVGMSHQTYWRLCQFGFFAVIVALQIPAVRNVIYAATLFTWKLIRGLFSF